MKEFDEKTRVSQVVQPPGRAKPREGTACVVVIYTKEATLLGKRFPLDESKPTTVGRSADAGILLDGDSVSRRHARFERCGDHWLVKDDGSTNGTY